MERLGSDARRGRSARSGRGLVTGLQVATVVVMLVAIGMRGLAGRPHKFPNRRSPVPPLVEPLQLLGSAADQRLVEIAPRIDLLYRDDWIDTSEIPFLLQGCPDLVDWLPTTDGQRVERMIGQLRRAGEEEAFAALVLLFELARSTHWEPGILAHTQNAERLGQFFQDWLAAWAEPGVDDPLLYEPVMAATLVYARVMRTAYDAPALGRADAPYQRAKEFLSNLTGVGGPRLTTFGQALSTYDPAAFREYLERDDFLRGFEKQALVKFPKIDGECGR